MKSIEDLLDYYVAHMPKSVYLMKNKDRYPVIEKAVKEIGDMMPSRVAPCVWTSRRICSSLTTSTSSALR